MEKKANHFSGQIGFVLAAAGSAVGVGNLWRFPYLAAKDGGGLFLMVYLALVLTFGFTLLCSDIAIGRRTKKSNGTGHRPNHDGQRRLLRHPYGSYAQSVQSLQKTQEVLVYVPDVGGRHGSYERGYAR